MKEINCKLIVSDFDGTLLSSKYDISEGVKNAINEYVNDGGIFAVCTGRMLKSIMPQVKALGLKGFVCAYQGTVIADIETGEIIKDGGFSAESTAEICKEIKNLGQHVNVYYNNDLYTDFPKQDKYLKLYEQITGVDAISVTDEPMYDYVIKNGMFCQKVTSLVAPDAMFQLYNCLKEKFNDKYDVTYSASVLVELSPKGDDKGEALRFLAQKYGVPLEKCVAVGDSLNDLPMIKAAGIGVAVGNAVQPLKDVADYVAVSNDEGAVEQVIKKFGYKQ